MSSKSKDLKRKVKESQNKPSKKKEELTEEQYEKLHKDLEEFQHSFLVYLAQSENFDVVPTQTDTGQYLKREHYELVKQESRRLGLKVLYSYDIGRSTLVVNPTNMKVGVLSNGEVH